METTNSNAINRLKGIITSAINDYLHDDLCTFEQLDNARTQLNEYINVGISRMLEHEKVWDDDEVRGLYQWALNQANEAYCSHYQRIRNESREKWTF